MKINISAEIEKEFDYLYKYFPPEIVPRIIEEDINAILDMHFDERKYACDIQVGCYTGWRKC